MPAGAAILAEVGDPASARSESIAMLNASRSEDEPGGEMIISL
jgi:hypothetical protein